MSAGAIRERGARRHGDRPLRRPTVDEVLDLLIGEGLLVLAGLLVVGVTDRPVLWWAVAAVMLVVPVRTAARLRAHEPRRSWDVRGSPAVRDGMGPHLNASYGPISGGDGGSSC